MCAGMCVDMCVDICVDMCADMGVDMCVGHMCGHVTLYSCPTHMSILTRELGAQNSAGWVIQTPEYLHKLYACDPRS